MSTLEDFSTVLQRLAVGEKLTQDTSARAFATLMAGDVSPVRMSAFLTAFAVRDATTEEIVGAARAMRLAMRRIEAPDGAIDLCGTGGDGHGTLNVSTAAAFVVAACGVPVAKHGNRNMSSRTGTADVLEALGVRIDLEPAAAERCLREAGICFLFAQSYHPSMKHVAPIRRELGFRTIFNLLGPLSNPGGVRRQLLGVYSRDWLVPVAHVLAKLGAEKAWVVHGSDGLDEMTTTGVSHVAVLEDGKVSTITVAPQDVGLEHASLSALKGGIPVDNADAIRKLLAGARGAFRDIVILNAGAALVVADKVGDLKDGIAHAAQAIDSGAAANVLAKLETVSQGFRA
ncbi:MAG TPA: anthranilate phosphoribosyltransferase [Rhizomicrobium sp.]|nr:anthranilate phosphoribosyltransferase [Rhizomicrobium sp.]